MSTNKTQLTADDVKAFQQADRLAFHLNTDTARITAVKELRQRSRGPFAGNPADLTYSFEATHGTRETAFFLVHAWGKQNGTLAALRHFVKVGDELIVRARENNNQYMDDAGLHHDELLITVRRSDKTILHEFVLQSSNCPMNSARAISAA
jgi:hypothetical protein